MIAFGIDPASQPPQDFLIYEDNWDAFLVFDSMSTQWRMGSVGPTGLDYNVIPMMMESLSIDKSEMVEIVPCLRIMENEALKIMSENRARENKKSK